MPYHTDEQVLAELADAVKMAGSQKAFAKKHRLSPAYVNDVLTGRRGVSKQFALLLGYKRVVMYEFPWVEQGHYVARGKEKQT